MTIYYGNFTYFFMLIFPFALLFFLYIILRKKDEGVKRGVILTLMCVNLFQHLFKSVLYSHYEGLGFTALSTAYNMCALLIILSPVVFLFKNKFISSFLFPMGAVAGIVAIAVPYWLIGESLFSVESVRFYLCHIILFLTSALSVIFSPERISYKCFWRTPIFLLCAISIIILNDIICFGLDIYPGVGEGTIYEKLQLVNPCMSFGPAEQFSFMLDIADFFAPKSWIYSSIDGKCLPILWYLIPMTLVTLAISFIAYSALDFGRFREDAAAFISKIKKNCEK